MLLYTINYYRCLFYYLFLMFFFGCLYVVFVILMCDLAAAVQLSFGVNKILLST